MIRSKLTGLLHLRTFDALRYRDFRLLWLGTGCVSVATWMDQVARGWLLYELTDSPLHLGLIRGVQAIPLLFLSPVAGTVADRYDRKVQVMIAQILDCVMYGVVALLIITGQIQPWHVYVTAVAAAAVQTFQNPARTAMVADSVPERYLTNAVGLNAVFFNLSRATGPALAGFLIFLAGTAGAYAAQAFLYLVATVWTQKLPDALRYPGGDRPHHARSVRFVDSTVEGFKASWTNQTVRTGLLITGVASLFIIPFTTLFPVFARDLLDAGATGQGLLLSAMGVGALASAIAVASLGDQAPRGLLMLGGVTLYGLAVIAFSASTWFPLSMAIMVVVGLFHVSSHSLVHAVVQTNTAPALRGRTMAIFQQSNVLLQAGAMLVGGLAALIGAPLATGLMAGAGAIAMVAIFVLVPTARRIR